MCAQQRCYLVYSSQQRRSNSIGQQWKKVAKRDDISSETKWLDDYTEVPLSE